MSAKKKTTKKAKAKHSPASPPSSALFTLEDRDRINSAKERIHACAAILNPDSHSGADWRFEEAEQSAHAFAYDILRESLDTIDAAFDAAETREERAKKGKAA